MHAVFLSPRIRFYNLVWEHRLGIYTRGYVETSAPDAHHYVTMPYLSVLAILRSLALQPSDVFVDLGCGKGRVVCCAARFPIREAIGIDVNEQLCTRAQRNAEQLRGRQAPITILNAPAEDFDYRTGTVFYLFNPFGSATLTSVLAKLQLALSSQPRPVRIVYINPQYESVLRASGWLERYERWEPRRSLGLEHAVSFWRAKPGASR